MSDLPPEGAPQEGGAPEIRVAWHERSIEERNLLNPAFCAVVLWQSARGYESELSKVAGAKAGIPLPLVFVSASFVLRGRSREVLPTTIRTSMVTWMNDHALERSALAIGVAVLRPYVREALILGAQHGIFSFLDSYLVAEVSAKKRIDAYLTTATADAQDCANKAAFVGRWLYRSGASSTVLAIVGVQP